MKKLWLFVALMFTCVTGVACAQSACEYMGYVAERLIVVAPYPTGACNADGTCLVSQANSLSYVLKIEAPLDDAYALVTVPRLVWETTRVGQVLPWTYSSQCVSVPPTDSDSDGSAPQSP